MKMKIFGEEYNRIIRKKDKGIGVSKDILDYTKKILKNVLEEWHDHDNVWKEKISEDIGEIPIRLFSIEDIKVENELYKILIQLIDIENSKSIKNRDIISLIKKVYLELGNLKW